MVFLRQEIPCSTPKRERPLKEKPFACNQCDKRFRLRAYLQRHAMVHVNKKAFKCKHCPKEYSVAYRLKRHSIIHEQEDGQFECYLCNKIFIKKSSYLSHLEVHNSIYKCSQCPKELKTKYLLKDHMQKHAGAPQISCLLCSKKFYIEARLKHHIKNKHSGTVYKNVQIYKCPQCPQQLRSKYTLRNHMQSHTGAPQMSCKHCPKKFYGDVQLKQHIKIKHNDVVYKCPHCQKQLSSYYTLQNHMQRHTGAPQISCQFCSKKFHGDVQLKLHIKNQHDDRMNEKRDNNSDSGISSF